MPRLINKNIINRIISLRKKGWTLPELKKEINIGYGTIFRYIKGVEILPKFKKIWLEKRKGSIKRMKRAEEEARSKAEKVLFSLSNKERLIFVSALYWAEGSKSDFGISNTDPELIKIFVKGLKDTFGISTKNLRVSVRIYEDLDKTKVLKFWSKITGIRVKNFVSVNILKGKKQGKLPHGMCRVRVKKGGNLLKYIKAIKNQVVKLF